MLRRILAASLTGAMLGLTLALPAVLTPEVTKTSATAISSGIVCCR